MPNLFWALLLSVPAFAKDDDDDHDEHEVEVELTALPAPVRSAIEARWAGCTLLSAELEGKTYDVEFRTKDGERFEAEVTAAGRIREVEREDDDEDEDD
jgi:uncharacterized membrane protein YkoI